MSKSISDNPNGTAGDGTAGKGRKLSFKDKVFYGASGFGDSATYTITSTFLLFFMTTMAGIQPALAGTIVAVGSLWDAITCPVFGYLSDNCHSKMGRRRPFLLAGSIPLAATTMLLFTTFDAGIAFKAVYYVVIIIVYWSSFSCFFIPYMAFGAELTDDYDERTVLRSFTSVSNCIGGMVGRVCPTMIVDVLCSQGFETATSWQMTAGAIGALSGGAILLCFFGFKGRDIPLPKDNEAPKEKFNIKKMFLDYLDVLKIKPLRILMGASIIALMAITILNADNLYFLTYNMGYSGTQITLVLLVGQSIGLVIPFFVNAMAKWFDKRHSFLLIIGICAILQTGFRFIEINSMPTVFVLIIVYALCSTAYWQLMPTLLYDVGEYDEYHSGKSRIGSIMSLQSLAEAAAEAISIQLLGIILQFAGFNGDLAQQSETALSWIYNCLTILPAAFLIIACLFIFRYPITRKVYNDLKQKLADRKSQEGAAQDEDCQ